MAVPVSEDEDVENAVVVQEGVEGEVVATSEAPVVEAAPTDAAE
jgi:hypothetical protein